jgi:hypothetical protein
MVFCALLPLPTTVAFLIPSSPLLGPTPPLLSPSAANPLPALAACAGAPDRDRHADRRTAPGSHRQGPHPRRHGCPPHHFLFSRDRSGYPRVSLPACLSSRHPHLRSACLYCTVYSSHCLRRGRDGCSREATYRGRRWGLWLDLCGHEGHLPSQRGLQRPRQPATGYLLQPDALRAALLPSLAPHSIRLCSQEEREPPSARHRLLRVHRRRGRCHQ